MEANTIIIYLACIFFLFIIGKIFIVPLKFILKLIFNSIIGGILIFVINLIGGMFNFHIGLNILTAIVVEILGVPRRNFISNFKYIIVKMSLILVNENNILYNNKRILKL